jgi:L-alanine-DL-glutamate epimerase-like enolase superfamily enzyme
MAKITAVEAFQVAWADDSPAKRSGFVRVTTDAGIQGYGECSPMQGGVHSLGIIANNLAPALVGRDPLDHAVALDTLYHRFIKLGPEGSLTAAVAALDIALWDIKGKLLGQPVHKLLGGAWRTEIPFYTSLGGNAERTVDEVVRTVGKRLERDSPRAVKIRFDGDRTVLDHDIAGDIAKATAVRKLVGDDFMLGFDANNGYSVGGAIKVGRVLEELGYAWFEEPVQHYYVKAMGEVARRLDIVVSAGEQTYTMQGVVDLIDAGVKMIQCDPLKMGGITGLAQCIAVAFAHGAEIVPHQTQPTIGHAVNLQLMAIKMHCTKPMEWNDPEERDTALMQAIMRAPWPMRNGTFRLPSGPGLGIEIDNARLAGRVRPVAPQP